jgi:hypothetical protein
MVIFLLTASFFRNFPSLFLNQKVQPMTGVTHFLLIAVEKYHSKDINPVAFAKADAKGLVKAWQNLGYDPGYFTVLIDNQATKTAIETHLKRLSAKAGKEDRIIIFFAGHGTSIAGENLIVPVDAVYSSLLRDTCVPINTLLQYLRAAESTRNLLFLDCCHSGLLPPDGGRRLGKVFSTEDLVNLLTGEEYCVGFASCKTDQESISSPVVRHGIWTHLLIEALSGNAEEDTYEAGVLTSENLQTWLRRETPALIKQHKIGPHDQTPMAFGSWSDRFVIEDLNPLFDARDAAKKAAAFNMTSIEIFDTEEGDIKDLPGFVRKSHHVPEKVGKAQNDFVRAKVGSLVKDEIDEMSKRIKNRMGYTRTELKVAAGEGDAEGSITTPDFTYMVEVSQSDENPKEYIIKRTLFDVSDPDIINDKEFNGIFDGHFRALSFSFNKPINIDKIIDRIEAMRKAAAVELDYTPGDTSKLTVIFPASTNEIVIERNSINITIPQAASPAALVDVYKDTRLLLDGAKIKLLEGVK